MSEVFTSINKETRSPVPSGIFTTCETLALAAHIFKPDGFHNQHHAAQRAAYRVTRFWRQRQLARQRNDPELGYRLWQTILHSIWRRLP